MGQQISKRGGDATFHADPHGLICSVELNAKIAFSMHILRLFAPVSQAFHSSTGTGFPYVLLLFHNFVLMTGG